MLKDQGCRRRFLVVVVVDLAIPVPHEQRRAIRLAKIQREIDQLTVRIRRLARATNYHANIIWTHNNRLHDLEENRKSFLVRVGIEWVDHRPGEVHEHGSTNVTEDSAEESQDDDM